MDIIEIAQAECCDMATITQGSNGYPKNLYLVLCPIDWEDAERMAEKYNGEIVLCRKRTGHDFYENKGVIYEPIDILKAVDEDNANMTFICNKADFYEWFKNNTLELHNALAEHAENDDEASFVSAITESSKVFEEVVDEFNGLEEDHFLAIDCNGEIYNYPLKDIAYDHDVYQWRVFVKVPMGL